MIQAQCAKCGLRLCSRKEFDRTQLPEFCPMKQSPEIIENAMTKYGLSDFSEIYPAATMGEKASYETIRGVRMAVRPRIREIVELANRMNVKNVGMAFCGGLSDEANKAVAILEGHGLTIHSVSCKCGAFDKTKLGIPKEYKVGDPDAFEAACNPITQAEILNNSKTGFNIIVGLCVGHDMIFTMASKAPVTTLIAKDRVTGHNPVASLYAGYLRRLSTARDESPLQTTQK
jgi:uncharacterized metal-binding protein